MGLLHDVNRVYLVLVQANHASANFAMVLASDELLDAFEPAQLLTAESGSGIRFVLDHFDR